MSTVRKAVSAVIEERPAVALILGDFVYHASEPEGNEIDQAVGLVKPLIDAGIPTFAVLGNHDYSLAKRGGQKREELAAAVEGALEEAGVTVLQNEAATLATAGAGEPLYIVGVGSRYALNDRPEVALEDVPPSAARIVMMHHPDSFEEAQADGWIEATFGAAGNRLYVNRGIGMSLVPMRFLTPPEVTFFTLQRSTVDGLEEPQALD